MTQQWIICHFIHCLRIFIVYIYINIARNFQEEFYALLCECIVWQVYCSMNNLNWKLLDKTSNGEHTINIGSTIRLPKQMSESTVEIVFIQ